MSSLANVIQRFSQQTVVYWQKVGSDKYGKPAYADPVELAVRYEEKLQEITRPDGRKVISKGYLLSTDRLVPGSIVFEGLLTDWQALPTYPFIPTMIQGGYEIQLLARITELSGTTVGYESYI